MMEQLIKKLNNIYFFKKKKIKKIYAHPYCLSDIFKPYPEAKIK